MNELYGFHELDCMSGMKYIPDNYFDIGIVDPPWGRKEHGGKKRSGFVKQKGGSELFVKCGEYENEKWDNHPVNVDYFNELRRCTKNQIVWGCNYYPIQLGPGRII